MRTARRRKGLTLGKKLLLTNIIYFVLLIVVAMVYFGSTSLINELTIEQKSIKHASGSVRNFAVSALQYVNSGKGYKNLAAQYKNVSSTIQQTEIRTQFEELCNRLNEFNSLQQSNSVIEKNINDLTSASVGKSNGYIEMISKKLADPNGRNDVSTLERLVIIGANLNTTANYEIRVKFLKIKEDINQKENLLKFLDYIIKNAVNDIDRLAKTPFAQLPVQAKEINEKIKILALNFIENVNKQNENAEDISVISSKLLTNLEQIDTTNTQYVFSSIKSYLNLIVVLILGAAILGVAFSLLLSKNITRSITKIISGISEATERVTTASVQVSGTSRNIAEGASEQAAGIEEASSSLEEMSSVTQSNTTNASEADKKMDETTLLMEEAKTSMEELARSMSHISKSGDEIGKIVKSINEIAFQTNLLALNAAVEAARAGEAGAGFAVVAEEVRALAMRASEAADSTQELIEETVHNIESGTGLVERTSTAFVKQSELAGNIAGLVNQVARASEEQSQGIEQINIAVGQMESIVQNNSANAQENAAAAVELETQAKMTMELVDELIALVGGNYSVNKRNSGDISRDLINDLYKPKKITTTVEKDSSSMKELTPDNGVYEDF